MKEVEHSKKKVEVSDSKAEELLESLCDLQGVLSEEQYEVDEAITAVLEKGENLESGEVLNDPEIKKRLKYLKGALHDIGISSLDSRDLIKECCG